MYSDSCRFPNFDLAFPNLLLVCPHLSGGRQMNILMLLGSFSLTVFLCSINVHSLFRSLSKE